MTFKFIIGKGVGDSDAICFYEMVKIIIGKD